MCLYFLSICAESNSQAPPQRSLICHYAIKDNKSDITLKFCLLFRVSVDACNIDLGVILDDSTSIGMSGLMDETRFVRDLTRLFTISSTNTRVSVLTYADTASMKIYFNSRAGQDKWKLDFELMKIFHAGKIVKTRVHSW